MRTFSSAVRLGKTAEIWKERTSPRRATSAGLEPRDVAAVERDRPGGRRDEFGQHVEAGRLAGAVGTDQAWIAPRLTRSDTSLTALKSPKLLVRPSVTRMSSSLIPVGRPRACDSPCSACNQAARRTVVKPEMARLCRPMSCVREAARLRRRQPSMTLSLQMYSSE